jgi:hypothetical protein
MTLGFYIHVGKDYHSALLRKLAPNMQDIQTRGRTVVLHTFSIALIHFRACALETLGYPA